ALWERRARQPVAVRILLPSKLARLANLQGVCFDLGFRVSSGPKPDLVRAESRRPRVSVCGSVLNKQAHGPPSKSAGRAYHAVRYEVEGSSGAVKARLLRRNVVAEAIARPAGPPAMPAELSSWQLAGRASGTGL